ncbi:hypothetical protein DSO57_1036979 [Entomophthora muscae]|uniref:Uncharacterized protein n=1 Tax=Entomophthora muscae TaxID=34485 RepID=A0ACC2SCL8_9FUNG|nr:hypothetical protein DSO57_1036979 [Entomophthora muscae]
MSSVVTFTPITGCHSEGPICYLLELDGVTIMLDCGLPDTAAPEELAKIDRLLQKVDVILLTHPTLTHIGGYVRFHNRYIQTATAAATSTAHSIPVYATIPLQNMGRMLMLDLYHAQQAATTATNEQKLSTTEAEAEEGDLTQATIRAAFDHITPLRYSQPINLSGNCQGISVTAYGAGHTVGGTIWKIRKATDDIVYAPDFNHRKERHLNGTVLLSGGVILEALYRPSLLIMGAYSALSVQQPRKAVEQILLESITATLENEAGGGTVLLPVDSSARVLEIAFLLDQLWQEHGHLMNFPVVLISACAPTTLKYAKSMLEWMGGHLAEQFGNTRENPLDLKNIKLCRRAEDLVRFPGPKVVLASFDSLEIGSARQVFSQIATDPKNKVILTSRGAPGSLARLLFDNLASASDPQLEHHDVLTKARIKLELDLNIITKVPLEGAELIEFRALEQQRLEREAEQAAALARSKHIMENESSDSESDDGGGADMAELLSRQYDVYVRETAAKKGGFLRASFRMFPYLERKRKFDDYGETINHSNYATESESIAVKRERLGGDPEDAPDIEEPEQIAEPDPVPMKSIQEQVNLKLLCGLQFIGLEGRSDGRSLKTILAQLSPRKLILVHGTTQSTLHLAEYCRGHPTLAKSDVLVPENNSHLTVAAASFLYPIKIADSLLKSLRFHKYDDYELARVHGTVQLEEPSMDDEAEAKVIALPVLGLIDSNGIVPPSPAPVMVGEVRFAELKKLLQQEGLRAEFQGEGVLVCNDTVSIKKDGSGRMVLEGSLCSDYYQVRRLLYSQQAVL